VSEPPGNSHHEQARPDEALTDEALTDEALTDEALTDEARVDEARVDEEGQESFPASDSPSWWSGPPAGSA